MTEAQIVNRLQQVRDASRLLRTLPAARKTAVLLDLARSLEHDRSTLLEANQRDLDSLSADATPAFRDRLTITPERLGQMSESLRQVADAIDPIDQVVEQITLPNGLNARRVRAPLGVIFLIFESRPNVAVEAFSIAFKSGNAMILRGGSESAHTTAAIYALTQRVLRENNISANVLWGITDMDRRIAHSVLAQNHLVDVVIPRGGDQLIAFVTANTRIPIIKNDRGMCHVYVHDDASIEMAINIVVNAKTQRPGVCNAMETLLVHRTISHSLLPRLYEALRVHNVRWLGCPATIALLGNRPDVVPADANSFDTEHLDFTMNCRIVDDLDAAIAHIEAHGSKHSESIITASEVDARRFQAEIDAAAVYWNASTRFTDGFALGLGGEIGVSTQKLHVRGPVGIRELTSIRWVIDGTGQIRS